MATVTLMLKKNKPLKDNKYPYVVRVSSQGREKYLIIDSATESQFDKKTGLLKQNHPDFLKSNRTANKIVSQIQDKIYEAMISNKSITVDELILKSTEEESKPDFFAIAENKRDFYLKCGKQGTYRLWLTVLKKFKTYVNNPLPVDEITPELLVDYKLHLQKTNNANTVQSNFKVLRRAYHEAVKNGHVDKKPFNEVETQGEEVLKDRLTLEEIKSIDNLVLSAPVLSLSKDMFLFAFYCWGMRFRDVALLKNENIKGNTLSYMTSKSNFTKRMTLVMDDKCLDIVNKYKNNDSYYLFPLLKHHYDDLLKYENGVSSINAVVNKSLKSIALKAKIDKLITFHTARHSFVDILKKKGIPIEMRMQLVGHSSEAVHKRYHGDFDTEEMSNNINHLLDD